MKTSVKAPKFNMPRVRAVAAKVETGEELMPLHKSANVLGVMLSAFPELRVGGHPSIFCQIDVERMCTVVEVKCIPLKLRDVNNLTLVNLIGIASLNSTHVTRISYNEPRNHP